MNQLLRKLQSQSDFQFVGLLKYTAYDSAVCRVIFRNKRLAGVFPLNVPVDVLIFDEGQILTASTYPITFQPKQVTWFQIKWRPLD